MEEFQITEWPSEVGLQEQASNYLVGALVKSYCAERTGKRVAKSNSSVSKGDEHKWTVREVSRQQYILSKAKLSTVFVISIAITCLLAMWQTIYRRHDLYLGSQAERGKLNIDAGLPK